MLQLTTEAAELIKELRAERGTGSEMLYVTRSANAGVKLSFVSAADVGDQVGESEGVLMCVAAELANALDGKVLDVSDDRQGRALTLRAA
jgi:Fe-S cluster assembly iron-binding protein IscA